MTTAQRFHLIIDNPKRNHVCLWTQACRAMGWDKDDRELRLRVFCEALGRPIKSSSEIDHLKDFDAVKQHLLALGQPANLNAQVKLAVMPRTRLLTRIAELAAPALVAHIVRQRFTFAVWLRTTHPDLAGRTISQKSRHPAPEWVVAEFRQAEAHAATLDDLNETELEQLRNTLVRESNHRRVTPEPAAVAVAAEASDGDPDWNV
jgi:hypothetical protein